MKRLFLFAFLLVSVNFAACAHSPTSPVTPPDTLPKDTSKLHDPTVLIRNHRSGRAYFVWQSGQGVLGADTIQGSVTVCERFSAIADSANWMLATDTTTGWAKVGPFWFDPTTRPAWTADISDNPSPVIVQKDTTAEC